MSRPDPPRDVISLMLHSKSGTMVHPKIHVSQYDIANVQMAHAGRLATTQRMRSKTASILPNSQYCVYVSVVPSCDRSDRCRGQSAALRAEARTHMRGLWAARWPSSPSIAQSVLVARTAKRRREDACRAEDRDRQAVGQVEEQTHYDVWRGGRHVSEVERSQGHGSRKFGHLHGRLPKEPTERWDRSSQGHIETRSILRCARRAGWRYVPG